MTFLHSTPQIGRQVRVDYPSFQSVDDFVRLAKAYMHHRAASTAQLRDYLMRKSLQTSSSTGNDLVSASQIRTHIEEAVARIARAGLLNDDALARTRASTLLGKGLPAGRVKRLLAGQGLVAEAARTGETVAPDDELQAIRYAERRRLGPFASGRRPPSFARDVRALVRAGFSPDLALRVMKRLSAPNNENPIDRQ